MTQDEILQRAENCISKPCTFGDLDLALQFLRDVQRPAELEDLFWAYYQDGATRAEILHLIASIRAGHYLVS